MSLPLQISPGPAVSHQLHSDDIESDADIDDVIGDSDAESEAEEDLPLDDVDDGRSTNKVRFEIWSNNQENTHQLIK